MILNYFKSTIRRFSRNRQSGIINILGLSVGLASALLITLYAIDEFSYDKFHENGDQIYRFNTKYGPQNDPVPLGPYLLNDYLVDNIPEIISSLRIRPLSEDEYWFRYGEQIHPSQELFVADSNFFTFFSFPLIQGDPSVVLRDPGSLVISESAAIKIFGDNHPVGETVFVNGIEPLTITAVMKDFPDNSHFQASMIANMEIVRSNEPYLFENWGSFGFYYYFMLDKNAIPGDVGAKINEVTYEAVTDFTDVVSFELQALHDIRLDSSKIAWDIKAQGSGTILKGLIAVAVVILLLASANYVNMYIARATTRRKEIGIRKVLGAGRMKIFMHSMSESVLYIFISFVIALGMTEILIPLSESIVGTKLNIGLIWMFPNWIFMLGVLVLIALLAGFYPAVVTGRFRPADIFRGTGSLNSVNSLQGKRVGLNMRQMLIIFQFSCAISLIILSLSVNRQIRYMMDVDYGYTESGLFVIHNPSGEMQEGRFNNLKNILEQFPEIRLVSAGVDIPSERIGNFTYFSLPEDDSELQAGIINVHVDYFDAIGSRIIAGRYFSSDYRTESERSVVINRTAASALGKSPGEITGMEITYQAFEENVRVVGVVEDIHFFSLHETITPMIFTTGPGHVEEYYQKILISATDNNLANAIDISRNVWNEHYDDYHFNFSVIEDRKLSQYSKEIETGRLAGAFMILAILISLTGLYALASFIMASRVKEIAVRKVLGADKLRILRIIVSEFSLLVIVSTFIAWPVVWLALNRWLDNFAYREDINFGLFILAPLITLFAAWLTIMYHALKAASANPAHILKCE